MRRPQLCPWNNNWRRHRPRPRGWERGQFELHFPKRFTGVLKLMRCLPYRWYFPLVHRFTGL